MLAVLKHHRRNGSNRKVTAADRWSRWQRRSTLLLGCIYGVVLILERYATLHTSLVSQQQQSLMLLSGASTMDDTHQRHVVDLVPTQWWQATTQWWRRARQQPQPEKIPPGQARRATSFSFTRTLHETTKTTLTHQKAPVTAAIHEEEEEEEEEEGEDATTFILPPPVVQANAQKHSDDEEEEVSVSLAVPETLPEDTIAAVVAAADVPPPPHDVDPTTTNQQQPFLFLLLSAPRCGSDWLLNSLDRHDSICASGDYPRTSLLPWTEAGNKQGSSCTLAYVRDSIVEMTLSAPPPNSSSSSSFTWTPPMCASDYVSPYDTATNADTNNIENAPQWLIHRQGLCAYIQKLQGDYSTEAIARVYVDNFVQHDTNLRMECTCPDSTVARGLRVVTANWIRPQPPLHHTAAVGAKVIRLERRNKWERYMSLIVPKETNYWWVETTQQKQEQMVQFQAVQYKVDLDAMSMDFSTFHAADEENRAWAETYGGESLLVDFDQIRDDLNGTMTRIAEFLGVDSAASKIQATLNVPFANPYNGATLLDYIANPKVVREYLCANGFGSFIGVLDYEPVQHLVYTTDRSFASMTEQPGLDVTVLFHDTLNTPSTRFHAALPVLTKMSPSTIVVLSEGHSGIMNHNIRSLESYYSELVSFRETVYNALKTSPEAVLVSTSPHCCSNAMAHLEPGTLFHADGRRNLQTCSGTGCTSPTGDDNMNRWKSFMRDRVAATSSTDSVYLDASFIAGTARNMVQFINAMNIDPVEDDRAVLTDFMYQNPDKIVLDYNGVAFGERFDGVRHKMSSECIEEKQSKIVTTTSPLFLFSSRQPCTPVKRGMAQPVWDDSGVAIKPILDHVHRRFLQNVSLPGIDLHFGQESFYIVDSSGVWGSAGVRDKYRISPSEDLLVEAHTELMKNSEFTSRRWNTLAKTLQTTGFPYWAWYGDWKYCNLHNVGNDSVPIMTTCAATDCTHSFPTPSYMSIIDAQPSTHQWHNVFQSFERDYPWESKIRKVVWRGALSENDVKRVFDSQRWRLCKFVNEISDSSHRDMFDVGLTTIPDFLSAQTDIDESIVGGLKKGIGGGMNAFQKYTAVLDMDGNSWSSRFRTMLCYNSVAIKVEPAYVDYFFSDLVPWKHYIPVKNDLSDLLENVAYALDPKNEAVVQAIIASANGWCAERSTTKGLVYDMLDIWERYTQLLERADPQWTRVWEEKKTELLAAPFSVPMLKLPVAST